MSIAWRTVIRYVAGYSALAAAGVTTGVVMATTQNPGPAAPASPGVIVGDELGTFAIRGDVAELVPGVTAPLMVEVSNPGRRSIRLLTITVEARKGTAGCRAARHLRISSYDSARTRAQAIVVPSHGTVVVPLQIRLPNAPHVNQDSCQDAAFALAYAGTAHLLRRST